MAVYTQIRNDVFDKMITGMEHTELKLCRQVNKNKPCLMLGWKCLIVKMD